MSDAEREAKNWQARAKRWMRKFSHLGEVSLIQYKGNLFVEVERPRCGTANVGNRYFTVVCWDREDVLDQLNEWRPTVEYGIDLEFCAKAWQYEALRLLAQVQ